MAGSFLSRLWNSISPRSEIHSTRSRRLHLESLEHRELFAVLFDSNFEDHGKVLTPVASVNLQTVTGMAVQKDRKIVVVGNAPSGTGIVLTRYEPDGNLDVTFGTGGVLNVGILGVQSSSVADVAIQKDGKIVIVGSDYFNGQFAFLAARYNSNGQLDTTFQGTGVVKIPIGSEAFATSVALQNDGKLVIGGYSTQSGNNPEFTVVRLTTSGALDTTFASDGIVTRTIGNVTAAARKVLIQTDGKIVLAGDYGQGYSEFVAMRFTAAGAPDTTFSGDGVAIAEFHANNGLDNDVSKSATLQSDGKLLIVGTSGITAVNNNVEASVVRFNTNGTLDTTFSGDGKATAGYNAAADNGLDVVQRNGKILVSGTSTITGTQQASFFQFTAAGVLDKTFDGDGRRNIAGFAGGGFSQILALPSGNFLAAGVGTQNVNGVFALSRFIETRPVITSFVVPARATLNQRVHLSGLASDPNQSSATLKYTWTIIGPRGFRATLVGKNANFVASVKGTLTVTLTVLDEEGLSATLTERMVVA